MEYFKNNFEFVIKKRPYTQDVFYNNLVSQYPEYRNVKTVGGDVYEAISSFDLVVGSHSTAVIDSVRLHKPFLLLNTIKWGNYFNVNDEESSILVESKIIELDSNK